MPSRNRAENAWELASRSLKDTGWASLRLDLSDITLRLTHTHTHTHTHRAVPALLPMGKHDAPSRPRPVEPSDIVAGEKSSGCANLPPFLAHAPKWDKKRAAVASGSR